MTDRTLSGMASAARASRTREAIEAYRARVLGMPVPARHRWLSGAIRRLHASTRVRPVSYYNPTPPQLAFHRLDSRSKLLRGANQIGKTTCAVVDIIWRCTGTHPFLETRKPPIRVWIIVHSWEQSIIVQERLWEWCPKDQIHPDTEFVEGRGFRGKTPILRFSNGSIIRIKTCRQGSLGVASGTVDLIHVDEPPPPEIWSELSARVLQRQGVLSLGITPVGAPVGWLKGMVESGAIQEVHAPLTVENVTPRGRRPMLTEAQIEDIGRKYLPFDRPQRLHGAWEGTVDDRLFEALSDEMITDAPIPDLPQPPLVAIGIDHGADAGSQVAVLVVVDKSATHPQFFVLDEYCSGAHRPLVHARGILAMLARNGMTHAHVDHWIGDVPHRGKRRGGAMSNSRLSAGFEEALGLRPGRLPFRIKTAYKPRYSVFFGAQVLHESMERGRFWIRPACTNLLRSLKNWAGADDDYKHSIDALRYGAVTVASGRFRPPPSLRVFT